MIQKTQHVVTIDAWLSPVEYRDTCVANCVVYLKSRKRIYPWFFPIFYKKIIIGKSDIILTHNKTSFPINVILPKVSRDTDFDVFCDLFRQYKAVGPITVKLGWCNGNQNYKIQ